MVNRNNHKVEGTLDFGIKLSKTFFMVISFCFLLLFLTCLIPLLIIISSGLKFDNDVISLLIFSVFFLVVEIIILIVYLRQKFFFKNEIGEFLNDPQIYVTNAVISEWSIDTPIFSRYKVSSEFTYNGEKKVIRGKKYCKRFKKFIGKQVKILYSPKYDQVIILKNQ